MLDWINDCENKIKMRIQTILNSTLYFNCLNFYYIEFLKSLQVYKDHKKNLGALHLHPQIYSLNEYSCHHMHMSHKLNLRVIKSAI